MFHLGKSIVKLLKEHTVVIKNDAAKVIHYRHLISNKNCLCHCSVKISFYKKLKPLHYLSKIGGRKINHTLEFLQIYHKNVKIIEKDELRNYLPYISENWFPIFKENDRKKRIEKTLNIWKMFVSKELTKTIHYMEENLMKVELITYDKKAAVLYVINHEKDTLYYEGILNIDFSKNMILKQVWNKMPKSLINFYTNVHNGFYYYPSHSLGLVELNEVMYFNDYEWGIVEELESPIKINFETTFGFFCSGGGGYAAIDISQQEEEIAVIWYDDCEPDYSINFWDVVDEWIIIGFQS